MSSGGADFATTHWTLIVAAAGRKDGAAEIALAELCQRYWRPVYIYVRRRTAQLEEAQDLTQGFFTRLLEKNVLAQAAPERGRFRAFLLTAVKNFLLNEWDRAAAQKRGGGTKRLALDFDASESRISLEPAHAETPEQAFDHEWALPLLDSVYRALEAEQTAGGKARQFELLRGALAGGRESLCYAEIAAELGQSEAAVRQAASRLRKRYREILRREIAQTVETEGEIDEEIRRLFEVLA
jgi:RNA polymerase sigma-70 factor (ECF subfamily)